MTVRKDWNWHIVPRAADLEAAPVELPAEQAQPWCNFVLWKPTALPEGCRVLTSTLRKEAPPGHHGEATGRSPWSEANNAVHRSEIAGPGRRLRIKQFLYDWAFPAADHPCLWGSHTRPVTLSSGHVLWFGTDYLNNPATSVRMSRTTVELSVLEGQFTDAELTTLHEHLVPGGDDVVARVLRTPFHALSYWARYPVDMVAVPTGLYTFQRRGRRHEGQWAAAGELAAFLDAHHAPRALDGFTAESAATFTGEDGAQETEIVYTRADLDAAELRVVLQQAGKGRIPFPPRREKHPATTQQTDVAGHLVHLACIDPGLGPFDAQWSDPATGTEGKLVSSTHAGVDRETVLSALGALLAPRPPRHPKGTL
ncbi:hypothetical protein [Actinacidiphila rubida]|uniref:Uncharacterized protein n=1 Tax=Actinacidiphila rubida TaxID=310780 RepID=A0A1H8R9M4_9ACTN|nr:hypothetical protein [Actinacidiphila rubida]SEO62854.1 hypothetical protein SAMN05216267_103358 [Actinacidiphila rubida]